MRAGSWLLLGALAAVASREFGHAPEWLVLAAAFVTACAVNHVTAEGGGRLEGMFRRSRTKNDSWSTRHDNPPSDRGY